MAGPGAGSILEQLLLYQVAGQLIGAALTPYTQALTNQLNSATPLVPLSPADVAEALLRDVDVPGGAAHEASMSGVDADRLGVLAQLAGNAPAPEAMAVALRRRLVDEATYTRGIRQGRLRDEWGPLIRELAVQEPSPTQALEALVEGQLSEGEARDKFAAFGGMPSEFEWLYGTMGSAPSPNEAAAMAHRGLIPWTGKGLGVLSFEQAVAEGHTRTKWTEAYRGLNQYLPPPRTITAMVHEGALTPAQGAKYLQDQGLSAELAAAYIAGASHTKVAKAKELSEATVLRLYRDRIVPRTVAAEFLAKLGYTTAQADYILAAEDMAVAERFITAAVNRVHTLYVGHRLTEVQASSSLASLGVANTQAAELVALWGHERAASMRELTPAEVASAMVHKIVDQASAQADLEAMGYAPHDAWVYLSIHAKGPLPNEPGGANIPAPAGP